MSKIATLISPYVYVLTLLLAVSWCYRNPLYNFDMIPYAAQALLFEQHDPRVVHDQVYSALKRELPGSSYATIAGAPHACELAADARKLSEALPFFSTKPLYIMAVYLSYRLGFNLAQATVVPSVLSYGLLGLLIFGWIGHFITDFYRAIFSLLIMFSPPVLLLARLSAPDALSTALVVAGLYFILEKESLAIASGVLLASIYARTNNLILVMFIFGYLALYTRDRLRLSYAKTSALVAVAVASVAAINHFSGFYGWQMLFYTSVLGHTSTPAETVVHVSLPAYLGAAKQGLFAMALKGFESVFAFVGLLAIFLFRNAHRSTGPDFSSAASATTKLRIYRDFTIGLLATVPLYFLLLPSSGMWFIEERYFAPQYLFVAIACVVAATQKFRVSKDNLLAARLGR